MTATPIAVADAAELAELLRQGQHRAVRLCGRGSQAARTAPPPAGATLVSLERLDRIERLQPADQTCSVQPGMPLAELDAELARHHLELGLAGEGSLGGVLALDLVGPLTVGGPSPRTVLLGMTAVLAEGLPFHSGARVVKSVAGFDVHKLLLGSRGRLFAATLLHCKLRPRPQAAVWFRRDDLDAASALRRFAALRQEPVPPARFELWRHTDGSCAVTGCMTGRPRAVAEALLRHELPETAGALPLHLLPPPGAAVVGGTLPASALLGLFGAAPPDAPILVRGGGRFEVALPAAAADALLAALPPLGGAGAILLGGPAQLGRGTPRDPGAARLDAELKQRLDPRGVLV